MIEANSQQKSQKSFYLEVSSGMKRAIPIVLSYFPVSFAFGVLASQAGLTPLEALAMGVLVFAGSGQFIGIGLLAGGASIASIIFTTFIINLRHLLMSAAIAPYLSKWSRFYQCLFAYEMTDETFAVNIAYCGQEKGKDVDFSPNIVETISLNMFSHFAWFGGGFLGALFGDVLGDVKQYGFDFAITGMFIALVVPLLKNKTFCIVACLAGLLSVLLLMAGEKQWNIMIATILAATIGSFLPTDQKDQ
ncbi:AzlC family ABC transporter permease [Desulfovibrio litoralis]|uniref:4-azaleucine resistance probable transporter AzlC n=1 Tax=Desulfovibrio litoralis DSM 11393 TaxID=1121455 RepID=A0A1M7RTN2_9BACT|nr:AzlC family ABC transporter permease [Desulfovibrio litoralis]SHN49697.1 4-azaleucine resistance probable transporter AzlC [Desulfovibrio litoralis DSM 11393]